MSKKRRKGSGRNKRKRGRSKKGAGLASGVVFDPGDDRSITREEYRGSRRLARVSAALRAAR